MIISSLTLSNKICPLSLLGEVGKPLGVASFRLFSSLRDSIEEGDNRKGGGGDLPLLLSCLHKIQAYIKAVSNLFLHFMLLFLSLNIPYKEFHVFCSF
jgi:hypothetical protein